MSYLLWLIQGLTMHKCGSFCCPGAGCTNRLRLNPWLKLAATLNAIISFLNPSQRRLLLGNLHLTICPILCVSPLFSVNPKVELVTPLCPGAAKRRAEFKGLKYSLVIAGCWSVLWDKVILWVSRANAHIHIRCGTGMLSIWFSWTIQG